MSKIKAEGTFCDCFCFLTSCSSWAVVREGGEVVKVKPARGRAELQGNHDQSSHDK